MDDTSMKPTIARRLHDTFAGRDHFTSEDILAECPGMRLQSAQSIICRFKGKHFDIIITGVYRAIGKTPGDRLPPGRKKPYVKPESAPKKVVSLVVDWLTTPRKLPISIEGWRK